MRAVGRLVQEMCEETRAGWSWMLILSADAAPGRLAFHGPKGMRSAADDAPKTLDGDPRLELWPGGGANRPVVELSLAANQDLRRDLRDLHQRRLEPFNGWLVMLALLHALDEAARTRPRVPTVGDVLVWSGAPTLSAWASAMTLGDLESALLRARP